MRLFRAVAAAAIALPAMATVAAAALNGASIVRVHDVRAAVIFLSRPHRIKAEARP